MFTFILYLLSLTLVCISCQATPGKDMANAHVSGGIQCDPNAIMPIDDEDLSCPPAGNADGSFPIGGDPTQEPTSGGSSGEKTGLRLDNGYFIEFESQSYPGGLKANLQEYWDEEYCFTYSFFDPYTKGVSYSGPGTCRTYIDPNEIPASTAPLITIEEFATYGTNFWVPSSRNQWEGFP